jgi:hypothetical protein
MSDRPTFSLTDDWVTLADLDHLSFRIYCILRTNAEFGRNSVVNHTVHVTASWVVDSTRHWKKPLALSTVRKHMQNLVDKGVLVRVNDPNEGLGVMYEFVADPGEGYEQPVNGFEHAKRISRGRGTTSVYRRVPIEGLVIGVDDPPGRSGRRGSYEAPPLPLSVTEPDVEPDPPQEEPEFDLSGLDRLGEPSPEKPTGPMAEFAAELESATSQKSEEKLRLMTGACRRIAVAVGPALERGWGARELAIRLAAELNPKIHSPEKLLLRKIEDLGDPPVRVARTKDEVIIGGKAVDLGSYDMGFGHDAAPAPVGKKESPPDGETKEDRLRRIARMAGRRK